MSIDLKFRVNFSAVVLPTYLIPRPNNIFEKFSKQNSYTFDKKILNDLRSIYSTSSVSDEEILFTIKKINKENNYLADPHTSTGLHALLDKDANQTWVSLACAHPAKFGDAIEQAIGHLPVMPKDLSKLFDYKEKMIILNNNKEDLKSLILSNI